MQAGSYIALPHAVNAAFLPGSLPSGGDGSLRDVQAGKESRRSVVNPAFAGIDLSIESGSDEAAAVCARPGHELFDTGFLGREDRDVEVAFGVDAQVMRIVELARA